MGIVDMSAVSVVFLQPDRLKEAGTVASGSTHLLPILPQSENPQQVFERRF